MYRYQVFWQRIDFAATRSNVIEKRARKCMTVNEQSSASLYPVSKARFRYLEF